MIQHKYIPWVCYVIGRQQAASNSLHSLSILLSSFAFYPFIKEPLDIDKHTTSTQNICRYEYISCIIIVYFQVLLAYIHIPPAWLATVRSILWRAIDQCGIDHYGFYRRTTAQPSVDCCPFYWYALSIETDVDHHPLYYCDLLVNIT